MREEDLEVALKVVIVGNGAVGKSSMIQRFCKGTFTKEYKKTIGVDFLERQVEISPGEPVRLMLWDTAGQEEFDALTKAYYRGAHACLLAFSSTDRLSFLAVSTWRRKVEEECGNIPMVLVQNKIDVVDQCMVHDDEANRLAQAIGCPLFRTSVREGIGVSAPFTHLAQRCVASLRATDYLMGSRGIGEDDDDPLHQTGGRGGTVWNVGVPHAKCGRSSGTVVLRKGNTSKRSSSSLSKKFGGVLDGACLIL